MRATVVVLTKLPGHLPVKTRLVPVLGEAGVRELYVEMLRKTVALARTVTERPILAYSPPEGDPHAALPDLGACEYRPVAGDDGAACLENALADAFEGRPLIALGGDAPDLPAARLEAALDALESHDAVFVPTPDGGFSCLALREPVPGLAGGFTYGGADSLSRLHAFLADRGLRAAMLEPWPDVDTPEDLAAYRRRS